GIAAFEAVWVHLRIIEILQMGGDLLARLLHVNEPPPTFGAAVGSDEPVGSALNRVAGTERSLVELPSDQQQRVVKGFGIQTNQRHRVKQIRNSEFGMRNRKRLFL